MRTYSQLATEERARAEKLALQQLLEAIVEGGVRFDDGANKDDLQARIDKAFAESERMQTVPQNLSISIKQYCLTLAFGS